MSEQQSYVVVTGPGGKQQKIAEHFQTAVENSMREEQTHMGSHMNSGHGPLTKAIENQESLYKYISWEDPVRTLATYIGLLGLLCGLHFLHPTQLILKICASWLGMVALTSLVRRGSKRNDLMAQRRPETYRRLPESPLNATLKDIHDLVQFCVVQAQSIFFGGDLRKTVGAFIGSTVLFWLIKFVSPFGLAVLALHAVFAIPAALSPEGRDLAHQALSHAHKLANAGAARGKEMVNASYDMAVDLSCKAPGALGNAAARARDAGANLASGAQRTAGNMYASTSATASNLASGTQRSVANAASGAQRTAGNMYDNTTSTASNLASGTRESVANAASGARDTAAGLTSSAQQAAGNAYAGAVDKTSNLTSGAQHMVGSAASGTQETAANLASGTQDTAENIASGTQEKASNLASGAQETAGNVASGASDLASGAQHTAGNAASSATQIARTVIPGVGLDPTAIAAPGSEGHGNENQFTGTGNRSTADNVPVASSKGRELPLSSLSRAQDQLQPTRRDLPNTTSTKQALEDVRTFNKKVGTAPASSDVHDRDIARGASMNAGTVPNIDNITAGDTSLIPVDGNGHAGSNGGLLPKDPTTTTKVTDHANGHIASNGGVNRAAAKLTTPDDTNGHASGGLPIPTSSRASTGSSKGHKSDTKFSLNPFKHSSKSRS